MPQPVAITEVDLQNRVAKAMTRRRSIVQIDLRYPVGSTTVIPAVGEQWFVTRENALYYRLASKIPFNPPEQLTRAAEGQVHVGSSGPLELNGSQVNANAPIRLATYATDELPDPAGHAGQLVYDTDRMTPVYSDGTAWAPAGTGAAVTDAPQTPSSPGTPGQIAWDSTHLYVCIAQDTWRRVALSSW